MSGADKIGLAVPNAALLPSYLAALEEGDFSPMQLGRGIASRAEIEDDPQGFLTLLNDPAPFSYSFENGRTFHVTRHELLWIAAGDRFLGAIALRYQGAPELLDNYGGHIGMAVRPGLLGRGYGPRAIKALYDDLAARARREGLGHVYATCHPDNTASARLIEFFGGVLDRRSDDVFGKGPQLRYKIMLGPPAGER